MLLWVFNQVKQQLPAWGWGYLRVLVNVRGTRCRTGKAGPADSAETRSTNPDHVLGSWGTRTDWVSGHRAERQGDQAPTTATAPRANDILVLQLKQENFIESQAPFTARPYGINLQNTLDFYKKKF